jgi:hypothetical protein
VARRKRKEDVPIWKPPEFDEVGYMRKEIENAKISLVVVSWAVVGAILAYLFYALNLAIVGFLLGLFVFGALYFLLPMLGLPIHGFKRRDWASHAMVYFFSWLAFSILLLNAPFGDHTSPVVGSFQVGPFDSRVGQTLPASNTTVCVPVVPGATGRPTVGSNNTLYIQFRATDNVRVASIHVMVTTTTVQNASYTDVSGQPSACAANPPATNLPNTYAVTVATGPPNIQVAVTAVDQAGLSTTESISILA